MTLVDASIKCVLFVDKGCIKKANSHQKSTTKNGRYYALAMFVHLTNFLYPLGAKVSCAPMGFEVDDNIDII